MNPLLQRKSDTAIPRLLLSRREAAAALGVSLRTLDSLVADGLPRVKLRGRVMFRPEALRAYLADAEASHDCK